MKCAYSPSLPYIRYGFFPGRPAGWLGLLPSFHGARALATGFKPSFLAFILGAAVQISFLPGNMGVTARNGSVKFGAVVNGRTVPCEISERALKTHFGAKSGLQEDLFNALEAGRERIQAAAQRRLADDMTVAPVIDLADFDG